MTQARSSSSQRIAWTREMIEQLENASRKRAAGRIEQRVERIAAANASVGRRSLMWNAYVDSPIPYPSRVVLPNETALKRMERAQRTALQAGTAWCPKRALSALGVCHGIEGAPRCPCASALSQGAWSHILGEPWGPAPSRRVQAELWRQAVQYANGLLFAIIDSPENDISEAKTKAARILTRMADAHFNDPGALPIRGTGHILYVMHWHALHHARHREWTRGRSQARRWALGSGDEWGTIKAAPTIADGARILRLLCNALPGRARWRPSLQRRKHTCTECESEEVQLVWRSPSPPDASINGQGIAWCQSCLEAGTSDNQWANLPDGMLPQALRDHAAACRGHHPHMSFDHGPSVYGACPLCGHGEAGAEHIWFVMAPGYSHGVATGGPGGRRYQLEHCILGECQGHRQACGHRFAGRIPVYFPLWKCGNFCHGSGRSHRQSS